MRKKRINSSGRTGETQKESKKINNNENNNNPTDILEIN